MQKKIFSLLLVLAVLVSCVGTAFVTEVNAAVDTDELIVADWLNASTVVTRGADTLMSEYADAGITDVYLLVKGTAGKLAWQSSVSGVTLLYSSRDVLEETCTAAAKYGIRIHAWMMASRDDAYIARNSDALAYHFRVGYGSDVNQYINLRNTDYQNYITELVQELVGNYDIAGIHLDTIRYGALYYDWGLNARTELINNYGITTAEYNAATLAMCVSGGYSYYVGDDGYYRYSSSGTAASGVSFSTAFAGGGSTDAYNGAKKFAQMRIDTVTNFVKVVRNAAGSDKVVSCAIMPETANDSYSQAVYGQDPASLKDAVDYVAIMTYASQYGGASTWPANMAKSVAADGCNAVAAIQTFDCENTNADPTCQDIYDEYTNVLSTRATVNASSEYSGKILGYAFFRAAKTCLAGANVVDSSTINFSVHNQDEAETSLTKLVFTMKNGVKIQSISNKSGWGSSTFTISSDKTTLTISNSSSALGAYGSGTFTMTYTGTVDANKGACMLAVYKSSNVEDYAYCGTIMPSHTHSYTSSVTTAATCTTDGVMTYTCPGCGDSYTETIKATGHSYTSAVTTEATCAAEGVRTYTCSKCGDTYTEAIAKTDNHSYSSSYDSETGITTYTCSVCGDSYTSGCGLIHTAVETWSTGSKTHFAYCYNCHVGEEYYCYFVESERVAPTCTTDGSVTYVCGGHYDLDTGELVRDAYSGAGCTNTYTETLKAAHNFTYAGNQDGTHTGTCAACGATTVSACAYIDGECCVCGDRELLYFDFTNSENAQARYDSEVYGNYNYDTGCWKSNTTRNEEPTFDNNAGTMTTKVVGEYPYLQTNDGSNSMATYPLNFNPSEVEMIELRLKLNGLIKATDAPTRVDLRIYKQTAVVGEESSDVVTVSIPFDEANLTSNEFFTLTVPARGLLDDVESVPAIRLTLYNVKTDGSDNSAITFDYIYIGPNYTDKAIVCFMSEDGSTTYDYEVATPGSQVSYNGIALTKASTDAAHYNFVGWKTADGTLVDLTTATFTEDTNLYPAFAEVSHRYVLNNSVEPTCQTSGYSSYTCRDCGYDHTVNLSVLDYHNYGANGICIWCGDGSGSALLHFKAESDELNWSWQFTNGTDTTVSFRDSDKNGVMYAATDATTTNPYFEFTNTVENIHTIQSGDIVEIRYRITNTSATGTTPIFRIQTSGNTSFDGRFVSASLVPTKSWQILQIPIDSADVLGKTIERFAFTPGQGNGAMKCEIDYIYIGQPDVAPVMLTYYRADGSVLYENPVAYGTLGTWYGDAPEKEGHTFIGWTDSTGTTVEPTAMTFTEDTELFPAYRCNSENVEHYDAVAATCTEAGNAEYWYCSVCDKYFADEACSMETTQEALTVEATDHDWVEATDDENYRAPTCTIAGFAPMVCSVCGVAGESKEIPALGHDMVVGTVHPATCTVDGYTDYACSRCDATEIRDIVNATGHSYTYTDNGDGTHTATCANCDYNAVEDHTFTDGSCVCGATEAPVIPTDSTLVYRVKSLSLQSYVAENLMVQNKVINNFDGGVYVVFERYDYKDQVMTTQTVYGVPVTGTTNTQFEYKVFSYMMADEITATLYGVKNGVTYKGESYTTSVADYVMTKMAAGTDAYRTLYANMLNYGANAQLYYNGGYNTDNLATSVLGEYASYITAENATTSSIANEITNDGATVTKQTVALGIADSVQLQYVLRVPTTMSVNNLHAVLTFTRSDGSVVTQTLKGSDMVNSGVTSTYRRYTAVFNGLTAKDGRATANITVYDANNNPVSNTWVYSIESYIAEKSAATAGTVAGDTLQALMNYLDAASAVFN